MQGKNTKSSGQDFVHTHRVAQELVNYWWIPRQLPIHGQLQGSSLRWSSGNTRPKHVWYAGRCAKTGRIMNWFVDRWRFKSEKSKFIAISDSHGRCRKIEENTLNTGIRKMPHFVVDVRSNLFWEVGLPGRVGFYKLCCFYSLPVGKYFPNFSA